jgi:hypothetical protein
MKPSEVLAVDVDGVVDGLDVAGVLTVTVGKKFVTVDRIVLPAASTVVITLN